MNLKLRELRQQRGLSLSDLSSILKEKYQLKVSPSQLNYFEKGTRTLRNNKIPEALADYFGVWLPYLLGNSNIRTEEQANLLLKANSSDEPFVFEMTTTESDEHDLLYNYRQLETPYKNQVRKFTRDMWELQKENKKLSQNSPDTH